MDVDAFSRAEDGYLEHPRVAVDAMGGDHAPEEVVRGAVDWAREHDSAEVLLVGDEARMRPFIDEPLPAHVRLVQAGQAVDMDEAPAVAVRRKKDASINVAMRLVRDGEADAVVTAGHTGAGVASAILHLKRLPGVDRPALAVQMITQTGPLTLLDIGATTDSTGVNLAQYAHMGSLFSERVLGVEHPRVALLSIGGEEGKGESRVQEATALLRGGHLNFVGNVEGGDVPRHGADVVVCDASVGNVVMKFFEGLSRTIFGLRGGRVPAPAVGPAGLPLHAPRHRSHPRALRLREAGRLAAVGRQRHGPHHARQRQAPHDRLRRGGDRRRRSRQHPRAHHRCPRLGGRGQVECPAQGRRPARRGLRETRIRPVTEELAASRARGSVHGPEREGRQIALAVVFEAEFGQRTATRVLERRLGEGDIGERAAAQATRIVSAVVTKRDTIDATIEQCRTPVSGGPARAHRPRLAALRGWRTATLPDDASPGRDIGVGRARSNLQRRAHPAAHEWRSRACRR